MAKRLFHFSFLRGKGSYLFFRIFINKNLNVAQSVRFRESASRAGGRLPTCCCLPAFWLCSCCCSSCIARGVATECLSALDADMPPLKARLDIWLSTATWLANTLVKRSPGTALTFKQLWSLRKPTGRFHPASLRLEWRFSSPWLSSATLRAPLLLQLSVKLRWSTLKHLWTTLRTPWTILKIPWSTLVITWTPFKIPLWSGHFASCCHLSKLAKHSVRVWTK